LYSKPALKRAFPRSEFEIPVGISIPRQTFRPPFTLGRRLLES